ncbi:MAG: hypothetical protein O3B24_11075, partial [Verrucomicrobia bacterium]|nr:hypothetical protein [Verrucomicrobiota bacterium]
MNGGNFKSDRVRCGLAMFTASFLCASTHAAVLLSTAFEADPLTQGWTTSGSGSASWTTIESFSATHSLAASNATWATPLLNTTPLQWYRLSFKTKAPGTVTDNVGSIGYGYWSALFYDTNDTALNDDQYSSVFASAGWVTNEFRIRAKHKAGTGTNLVPARIRVRFHAFNAPLYVDDVLIETTTPEEVAQWADAFYDRIPAKLAYVPKANHGSRLPLTMQRLRNGQPLRIVMLGDSVQQDTANAPIDALLQRLYPGATVELISSTRGGTGVGYYKDHVAEFIFAYRPDLLVIGGISNGDNMTDFQSIIDQVRADDSAKGRTTEIMIVTRQWSPNNNISIGYYFLAPGMTELDQVPSNNPGVPGDYRGNLLNLCHANGIEYLDMTGIAAQFINGPAAAAGIGPPANANGVPYGFWMRDWVHANDNGKMILGRILEAWFAPAPTLRI